MATVPACERANVASSRLTSAFCPIELSRSKVGARGFKPSEVCASSARRTCSCRRVLSLTSRLGLPHRSQVSYLVQASVVGRSAACVVGSKTTVPPAEVTNSMIWEADFSLGLSSFGVVNGERMIPHASPRAIVSVVHLDLPLLPLSWRSSPFTMSPGRLGPHERRDTSAPAAAGGKCRRTWLEPARGLPVG